MSEHERLKHYLAIEQLWITEFEWLIDVGYTEINSKKKLSNTDKRSSHGLEIIMSFPIADRQICFKYSQTNDSPNPWMIALINIKICESKKNWHFYLSDYWTWKKQGEHIIALSKLEGTTTEDRLIAYFSKVKESLKNTELLPVIKGEKWFDVPYDWQGQK